MTDTTTRRDFEAWATENYWLIVSKDDAFGIWQAATERATAIERERCAVVCESMLWVDGCSIPSNVELSIAIRQGGDT